MLIEGNSHRSGVGICFAVPFKNKVRKTYLLLFLGFLVGLLGGCAAIGGIFKAGVWTGILIVVIIIGVIVYFISRGSNRS